MSDKKFSLDDVYDLPPEKRKISPQAFESMKEAFKHSGSGYQSPITVYFQEENDKWDVEMKNGVMEIVRNYKIDVDYDELVRALKYDREQYADGWIQGYFAGMQDQMVAAKKELSKRILDAISDMLVESVDAGEEPENDD